MPARATTSVIVTPRSPRSAMSATVASRIASRTAARWLSMTDDNPAPDPAGPPHHYPGTPGWVKLLGVVAVLIVLLVFFALLTGLGGPHGPQRHGAIVVVAGLSAVAAT